MKQREKYKRVLAYALLADENSYYQDNQASNNEASMESGIFKHTHIEDKLQ